MLSQLASRLRFLASQIRTESQRLDARGTERREILGLALQLSQHARAIDNGVGNIEYAHELIDLAIDNLVELILRRTKGRDVPRSDPQPKENGK